MLRHTYNKPFFWLILLLGTFFFRTGTALALDTIYIKPSQTLQLAEFKAVEYFRDKTGELDFKQVQKKDFQLLHQQVPNFNVTTDAVWMRLRVTNQTDSSGLQLIITNPILDYVDFYYITEDLHFHQERSGELVPFAWRAVKHQNFIFNLNLPMGATRDYYLRVKSRESMQVPIYIGTELNIYNKVNTDDLWLALYITVIVVMTLYNVFIFLTTKDYNYLYYIFYIVAVGIAQVCLQGIGYRYLWHDNMFITEQSVLWVGALSGIAVAKFVQEFLHVRDRAIIAYHIFNGFIYLYLGSIALALLHLYSTAYLLIDLLAMSGMLFILVYVVIQSIKKYRPAVFFLAAWFIFIIAVVVWVLKDTGIIPYNVFSSHILLIGSALEVVLLSFALADKINTYKKEKEQSQAEALESQAVALQVSLENERLVKEQNILLEAKVQERTEELQASNNKLSETLINLKDAQTQLVESEKMASLGQLTAGIAHEINNPINFVTSNIKPLKLDIQDLKSLLDRYESLDHANGNIHEQLEGIKAYREELDIDYIHSEISSLIKGIEEGAARTAEIVKGLRTFSRLDESDLKYVDIHEGLDSTLVLLRNSIPHHVQLIKNYGKLPKIECYAGKLNQVFMNIMSNGLNAIKTKAIQGNESLTISTSLENNLAKIAIRDSGIGMTEEVKEKIFEPFFTTKDVGEGTGLGLSIVFSIIAKHNGKILVESTPGNGSEFIIYLPLNVSS
ncbi:hypothetical protein GA0116948_11148 [Chitinophaga costaii]|uniref:histidine kinase n=1 Tax=Chitinophaga costaii TaxID=1335309 RepID=A0A1C4F364_9BACT|nr:7TM diverse intracellular signaling domain-containing protein [Chitinophaga costaii]PUZ22133.1 ATPase [Chitinophaga costaii]SCC49941.1 hypothetical protein GA0116948_11148 [Chitinophaga costaii]